MKVKLWVALLILGGTAFLPLPFFGGAVSVGVAFPFLIGVVLFSFLGGVAVSSFLLGGVLSPSLLFLGIASFVTLFSGGGAAFSCLPPLPWSGAAVVFCGIEFKRV